MRQGRIRKLKAICMEAAIWVMARKEVESVIELCHAISDVLGVEMRRAGTEESAFLEKLKSW
jgi:hypothetical protein